jgi:hypothetical protein
MADELEDLRATADDLAEDSRRLEAIEERKGTLAAEDPELVRLSDEAEQLTRRMAAKATAQRELAHEVSQDA